MLKYILPFLFLGAYAQIPHTKKVFNKVFTSYVDTLKQLPICVTYSLYNGGGECSRKGDVFHNDPNVKTKGDNFYKGIGYDKGHLANAEDFAYNDSLQTLTFLYSNCVPQTPELNRGPWKHYETKARELSKKDTIVIINYMTFVGKILIPNVCYKAVYSKRKLLFIVGLTNTTTPKEIVVDIKIKGIVNKLYLKYIKDCKF